MRIGSFNAKPTKLYSLFVSASILVACGGDSNNDDPILPPASASISLDANITDDDLISRIEINDGSPVTITGITGNDVVDGDTVSLNVNGNTYTGNVTNAGFSIDIPVTELVNDSDMIIEASVTTSTNNPSGEATATDTESYSVEPSISATITINTITSDNEVSQREIADANDINISGNVGGDVANGDVVTLSLNSSDYTASVVNGEYNVDVDINDLINDTDTRVNASVTTSTGNSGGEITATAIQTYTIESVITASISLDTNITNDDQISQAEISAGTPISITGTVGGNVADGDQVSLTVNNTTLQVAVSNMAFNFSVPVTDLANDDDSAIEVSVTTSASNSLGTQTASDSESYTVEPSVLTGELIDPNPAENNRFGDFVLVLPNNNIIVSSPFDGTQANNNGAIHLYDGNTYELITSIYGESINEQLGLNGESYIKPVGNDNFVVVSPSASIVGDFTRVSVGAVRVFSASTGAQIGNTLFGDFNNDKFGEGGITVLNNGNFIVSSPSARLIVGTTGFGGVGSYQLIDGNTGATIGDLQRGRQAGDQLSNGGIYALPNNNYVVSSFSYTSDTARFSGSIRLHNGETGALIGIEKTGNAFEQVGRGGVIVLPNNNYAVLSPLVDASAFLVDVGEVALHNGDTGDLVGFVRGPSHSFKMGENGGVALDNNFFLVNSNQTGFNNSPGNGAVSLINGINGTLVSRVQGTNTNTKFGAETPTVLNNGNYVLGASLADINFTDEGFAGLYNGTSGAAVGNGLTGSADFDMLSSNGIIALENGNFVVLSSQKDNTTLDSGSATLVNGTSGNVIASIEGNNENDRLSSGGALALSNGNYIVLSPFDDTTSQDNGSVRLMDGTTGLQIGQAISSSDTGVQIGSSNTAFALETGNFVVFDPQVTVDGITQAGQFVVYDGLTGQATTNTINGTETDFFANGEAMIYDLNDEAFIVAVPGANNGNLTDSGFVFVQRVVTATGNGASVN